MTELRQPDDLGMPTPPIENERASPMAPESRLALPSPRGDLADRGAAWETAPDTLADMSLSDLVDELADIPARWDEEQAARIGVRLAPYGFRVMMGELAHEHRISYSRLTRFALQHGMAILDGDPGIIALRAEFRRTTHAAMSRGDRDALTRLNQTGAYEFQHPQHDRTTLTVSRETQARIEDLARTCGISSSRLGVLAMLVSLTTLRDPRQYLEALRDEVRAFHRSVQHRRKVLTLGMGLNHDK